MFRYLYFLLMTLHGTICLADVKADGYNNTVVLSNERSFQEQLTKQNTIYMVRYDFDLYNRTVFIPSGCSLCFDGGQLANGRIEGKDTRLVADKQKIFDNVEVKGTWDVNEAYPEWFGAKGDGVNDDSKAVQQCIDASFSRISLQVSNTPYIISRPIIINKPVVIEGEGGSGSSTYAKIETNSDIETIFYLKKGCAGSRFSYLNVNCNNKSRCGFYSVQEDEGSYLHNLSFTNVRVTFAEYGFRLNKLYSCMFTSCHCHSISKIGFCFNKDLTDGSEGTSITAINCGSSTWNEEGGIGWYFNRLTYCSLINCGSDDNDIAYQFRNSSNFTLMSSGCENCGTPLLFDYDGYSMGFSITSFRVTNLKQKAPYDWILYSGGLYNTTITGIHINSNQKRTGDIYTRYANSSIVVLDNASISPQRCTDAGTAVLFPTFQITKDIIPRFDGQIHVDNSHLLIAQKDKSSITWKTIYSEPLNILQWVAGNTSNTAGGYREFERIVFINARFVSGNTSSPFSNIAINLPENEIPESYVKITDNEGNEIKGVMAKVTSTKLLVSGLQKGKQYLVNGFYFRK